MKSWQTTIAGALVIIAAVLGMAFGRIDPTTGMSLIGAGIIGILSRQNSMSDGDAGAKTVTAKGLVSDAATVAIAKTTAAEQPRSVAAEVVVRESITEVKP